MYNGCILSNNCSLKINVVIVVTILGSSSG